MASYNCFELYSSQHQCISGIAVLYCSCLCITLLFFKVWMVLIPRRKIFNRTVTNTSALGHGGTKSKSEKSTSVNRRRTSSVSVRPAKRARSKYRPESERIPIFHYFIISALFCSVIFIYSSVLFQTLIVFFSVHVSCVVRHIPSVFAALQRLCIYCYFWSRLFFTFSDSELAISRRIVVFMSTVVTLSVAVIVFYFWFRLLSDSGCHDDERRIEITFYTLILDFIWLLSSVISTIYKLRTIINSMTSSSGDSANETHNSVLYYLIFKLSLCALLALLCTCLIYFIFMRWLLVASIAFDQCFTNICVILSLKPFDSWYRIICFLCVRIQIGIMGHDWAVQLKLIQNKTNLRLDVKTVTNSTPPNYAASEHTHTRTMVTRTTSIVDTNGGATNPPLPLTSGGTLPLSGSTNDVAKLYRVASSGSVSRRRERMDSTGRLSIARKTSIIPHLYPVSSALTLETSVVSLSVIGRDNIEMSTPGAVAVATDPTVFDEESLAQPGLPSLLIQDNKSAELSAVDGTHSDIYLEQTPQPHT